MLFDNFTQYVKTNATISTFLQPYNYASSSDDSTSRSIAFLVLLLAGSIVALDIFNSIYTLKPPFISAITIVYLQQAFYIACQDLYLSNVLILFF